VFDRRIILFKPAGNTVCVPPGTYRVGDDIDMNGDGVTVSAPFGATVVYATDLQWFVRGNGNSVQNININCANSPYSGFVVTGGGNSITGCSVRQFNILAQLLQTLVETFTVAFQDPET